MWSVLPVVLGLDTMVAMARDAGWRGELDSLVECLAPVLMLLAPFLAGLGAWLARQDRALDSGGLLRSCPGARRHIAVRVGVASALPAALHLIVLAALAVVSLRTASVGGWPVGPLLVQLAAFPAFVALGYAIGGTVDHLVATPLAAAVALLTAYTDYGNPRWPLGFVTGGGTGSFAGHQADLRAIIGRLAFCAAVTGLALGAATWRFGVTRLGAAQRAVCAAMLLFSIQTVHHHQELWVEQRPLPTSDHCVGARPRLCVLPDYAGLAGRAAALADRAAALLRTTGATGLRGTYVGWFPAVPRGDVMTIFDPETAYQPAPPLAILSDLVAPKSCSQWYSGVDLDRESTAEQVVLWWLVEQDPTLSEGHRAPSSAAGTALGRLPPATQRVTVARLATDLATCRFADLPADGSIR